GLSVVVLAILGALLAGVITPFDPDQPNYAALMHPPSLTHWFGTDRLGRDQLTRVLFGLRVSLSVSALSIALSLLAGVALGLAAASSRRGAPFAPRLADLMLAFPFLVLAVGMAAILGPSLFTATAAIGVAGVPGIIRVTRSEALRLRGLDFVA